MLEGGNERSFSLDLITSFDFTKYWLCFCLLSSQPHFPILLIQIRHLHNGILHQSAVTPLPILA